MPARLIPVWHATGSQQQCALGMHTDSPSGRTATNAPCSQKGAAARAVMEHLVPRNAPPLPHRAEGRHCDDLQCVMDSVFERINNIKDYVYVSKIGMRFFVFISGRWAATGANPTTYINNFVQRTTESSVGLGHNSRVQCLAHQTGPCLIDHTKPPNR